MFRLVVRRDDTVGADAGVFVDDGLLDAGIFPDADARNAFFVTLILRGVRLVKVRPHQHRAVYPTTGRYETANADQALADSRAVDDAPVGNHRLIDGCPVDLRSRHETWPGVDRRLHLEEIKLGDRADHVQVCLEKGSDRSDVLPVSLIDVRENPVRLDGAGDDVLAKVGHLVV